MGKLKNARYELFSQYYVTELNGKLYNATQAAISAGYKIKTAYSQGSRLLKKVEVRERIEELKEDALKALEIDKLWLLQKYKKIVDDKLSNYLQYEGDERGNMRINLKDSDNIDTWNISEIKIGKDGQFSFKLNDKKAAMQKLGEYMDVFNNKEVEDSEEEKLTKQLEQIQTIAKYINNPQPNRSIDDE